MLLSKPINQQHLVLWGSVLGLLALLASPATASSVVHWQQPALGATLQLELSGVNATEFAAAEAELQQQLLGLLHQLDANNSRSALSQLNHRGILPTADSALLQLLHRCEQWYQQHGGYSCRLGSIHQQWQQAQLQGQLPDRVALRQQTRKLQQLATPAALQNRHLHWHFKGLDQAFIVDQVRFWCDQLFPHHTGLRLKLAEVLMVQGAAQAVTVAWPSPENANADANLSASASATLLDLQLSQAALAYSQQQGGYQLAYRSYSPVLHPREGWPVEYGPQVAVVAQTAVDAWLLAQSLAVLPVEQHPQLLAATKGSLSSVAPAAALLKVTTPTRTLLQPSTQWYHWLADPQQWQPQAVMQLNYQIRPQAAAAKRPYLSIWISQPNQQLVKQLSLQGQQARWHQELRQWWRRIGKPAQIALDSLSGATRKAGSYQLSWDGRDEEGKPVPPGDYILHLEIAREHGGHEKLSAPLQFEIGKKGEISGRIELGAIQWQVQSTQVAQRSRHRSHAG